MQNLFEAVKENLFFNKFEFNDIICVEYTCPVEEEHLGIYSQTDYIIHVLSGKKTWKTINGIWELTAGQTIYAKKGAAIITQDFDEDFCMLGFFLPDDLIRSSLEELVNEILDIKQQENKQFTITRLIHDSHMDVFFQSMLSYFHSNRQPAKQILNLKLKELLVNILFNCDNPSLKSYLKSIAINSAPSLPHIMETNFCYNLRMEEFAKMSHRSLSSFKRDFFRHYETSPGKWLKQKRLEYAANILLNNGNNSINITNLAFDSGFEDVSHFSRAFKAKFGQPPSEFRNQ